VLGAGYAAIVYGPAVIARRRLELRLREVSPESEETEDSVVRRTQEGPLPEFERFVMRTPLGSPLASLIAQSGVKTTPGALLLFSVLSATLLGVAAVTFVRAGFVAPIAAAVGAALPFGYLRRRRTVRLHQFEEQFPEALDVLSRAVRAGHAFQSALGMAAGELGSPVGPELKIAFDQQNFGLPLRDALDQLSARVPILDVKFFVTAVLIQRDSGGNLAEILDNLASVVRERFKVLRQVRVHTAHGRFTGYVLLALPASLAVALSAINPEHMAPLFREPLGHIMLGTVMVMQVVGYIWIRQVIRIEV
jgi:tight adherence protein B